MNEEYISLETARLLYELNFHYVTKYSWNYYPNLNEYKLIDMALRNGSDFNKTLKTGFKQGYAAPSQSILQKWLRNEFNINVTSLLPYKKGQPFKE